MRSRLPLLIIALLSLLALPAAAQAKLTVGLAENNPNMFGDPLFTPLGARHARLVVSWNVATAPNDELNRVIQYLHEAQRHGRHAARHLRARARRRDDLQPAREPQEGPVQAADGQAVRGEPARLQGPLPERAPVVAWNEINHFTQPTYKNPKAAAKFTTIARKVFKGGTVVAADILDQADDTRAKRPTFRATTRYVKAFRKAYKGPRTVCGVHNYSDVNRFRQTGTKTIIKALGCKQIWLTETGGLYKFVGFKASQPRQLKATKYMFKVARQNKKIKRLYVYSWFGAVTPRFDAGLVARGSRARPTPRCASTSDRRGGRATTARAGRRGRARTSIGGTIERPRSTLTAIIAVNVTSDRPRAPS